MIVKICGLTDAATLEASLVAGADMVGFVFFEASPRHLAFAEARSLAAGVKHRARKVALTVDADDATLAAAIEAVEPDLLQLHGSETPERVGAVRARFGRPVLKALSLAGPADLGRVAAFEAVTDYFLFDAKPPAGAGRPGGNGGSFDWTLLRSLATTRPWLLAGGLDEDNVSEALRVSGAGGVDVSSGVERRPGIKDAGKIARFIAASRAAS